MNSDIFTVCIGRQLGSGGRDIASIVAKELGISFYDKEIIFEAARQSGLDPDFLEKKDEKHSLSLSSGLLSLAFGASFYHCEDFNCINQDALFKIQSDTIVQLASQGAAVFVGRCADYILRDRERVLSIFVNADMDDRIARIMKKNNLSADEAAEQLRKTDKARADYYNYYTFKKWGDPSSYDVLLNSSRLGGVDATAAKIVEMCKDYFL
ncbi:MAG: AAA family ATPase [Candidatus Coprenecus sp.]